MKKPFSCNGTGGIFYSHRLKNRQPPSKWIYTFSPACFFSIIKHASILDWRPFRNFVKSGLPWWKFPPGDVMPCAWWSILRSIRTRNTYLSRKSPSARTSRSVIWNKSSPSCWKRVLCKAPGENPAATAWPGIPVNTPRKLSSNWRKVPCCPFPA